MNNDGLYSPRYYNFREKGEIASVYASRFILTPFHNFSADKCSYDNQLLLKKYLENHDEYFEEEIYHHIDLRSCPSWNHIQGLSIFSRVLCIQLSETFLPEKFSGLLNLCIRRWAIAILLQPIIELIGKWRTGTLTASNIQYYNDDVKLLIRRFQDLKGVYQCSPITCAYQIAGLCSYNIIKCNSEIEISTVVETQKRCYSLFIEILNNDSCDLTIKFNKSYTTIIKYLINSGFTTLSEIISVFTSLGFKFLKKTITRAMISDRFFYEPGIIAWDSGNGDFVIYDPEAEQTFKDGRLADLGAESRLMKCDKDNERWCRILAVNILAHIFSEYYFINKPDILFRNFLCRYFSMPVKSQIFELIDDIIYKNYELLLNLTKCNYCDYKILEQLVNELANFLSKSDDISYSIAFLFYVHAV